MTQVLIDEDPEPSDRLPVGGAGRMLCVPVRPGPRGSVLRLFRTPLGARAAAAFTSPRRLADALGGDQRWIPLAESALRALVEPLGVTALVLDPRLTARPVGGRPAAAAPVLKAVA
ncbi:hypothetical protein BIV57_16295 [Mangrovactinospora gilvigrisea]|uniref:SseB protein N-terminal domain-containing protein n=1 Tax=Mangrovactinospora gilvigrisea TaxID=1428644 RepID=A0A1J7C4F0_9ACTN|nr:SAV_915 family protein [Mangrovactinospora gilvigrisea]OIV36424.1 hypothetical protein BIV57_16295 [Mangrovactinospora gilvigrisea]